jgi:hypothetical protein
MTRKLALTVFAMSLALVGCGSSSTTKVNDAGKDVKPGADVVVQPDGVTPTGPEVGPEVQQPQPDAAVDTNNVTPPDLGTADSTPDAEEAGIVNGPEAGTKFDAQPKLDAIDAPTIKLDGPDADRPDSEAGEVGDGGDGGDGGEVG